MDEGQHVPSSRAIGLLLVENLAWEPLALVCDNYRAPELHQVVSGRVRIIERDRAVRRRGNTSNVQSLTVACYSTPRPASLNQAALYWVLHGLKRIW